MKIYQLRQSVKSKRAIAGVYLILTHPSATKDLYVKLESTSVWQLTGTMTINELIAEIGDNAVVIEDELT